MTTIAWDGITLAADSLSCSNGQRSRVRKLRRCEDGRLIAAAGESGAVAAYLNWLERCVPLEPAPMRPSFQHDADDCVHALEIMPDGTVWRHERFAPFIVEERSTAIGSGAAYALGAMAAGKSAPEAVVIACELHSGSALPMDSLRLRSE